MSASEYHKEGIISYPPWRARMGLDASVVTNDVEGSHLQLGSSAHWLQVNQLLMLDYALSIAVRKISTRGKFY